MIYHIDTFENNHGAIMQQLMIKVSPDSQIKSFFIEDLSLEKICNTIDSIIECSPSKSDVFYCNFTVDSSESTAKLETQFATLTKITNVVVAGGNINTKDLYDIAPCCFKDVIIIGSLNKSREQTKYNSKSDNDIKHTHFVIGTNQPYFYGGVLLKVSGTSPSSAYYAAKLDAELNNLEIQYNDVF